VMESYPYGYNDPAHPLLVVRGDWLVSQIGDPRKSDALYRLLYGGDKIPKTDEDFQKFWGVSQDNGQQEGQRFGWVEGLSQVNKNGGRLLERFNARGLSLWRTRDSKNVTTETDPAEQLVKGLKHDGRELIAQVMKTSPTKGLRGAAQAYLLADGEGKVVNEAPVSLVEDFTRTFNQAAIVTHSSCISCHTEGMKKPTLNALRAMIESGVQLSAYSQAQQEVIEEFYLSNVDRQLNRDIENYEDFVKMCNGLTPDVNATNYRDCILQYQRPLTRAEAARELDCTEDELSLALGYASASKIVIGNRLSALAGGSTIPRTQWEEDYRKVAELLKIWRNKGTTAGTTK